MKVAVISYHKNIDDLYPKEWINQHVHSMVNQSFNDFELLELNYGSDARRLFYGSHTHWEQKEFPTFVHGMNYLLDKAFKEMDCDYVFNTNIDDYYDRDRLAIQMQYATEFNLDILSTNFYVILHDRIIRTTDFHMYNIQDQLSNDHNIIAHPAVMYSRNFWLNCTRYRPEEIPCEDLLLWKRSINEFRFGITAEILLWHRQHDRQVSHK